MNCKGDIKMKKVIITIIAIATMMTLVSCGKEEPKTIRTSHAFEEEIITETIIEENVIEETVIEENIETEHYMSDSEYNYLLDLYYKGDITLEVLMEMVTTGKCTQY